jgi:zinc D-Ala-D-Ala carboxypeptidase
MTSIESAPAATRVRRGIPASAVLGLLALLGAAVSAQVAPRSSVEGSDSPPPSVVSTASPTAIGSPSRGQDGAPSELPRSGPRSALGLADGLIPDGTTVYDDAVPGVARLNTALQAALSRAADAAADDGIRFVVNSGWRSAAYEEQLFREAVSKYGSDTAAARWVATPETSPHVSGDAVDLGPAAATTWLSEHGARFGLCQIYRNEPWHYELRPAAVDHGCPAMFVDPTRDPRMRR